jgi:hypothetical protein
MRLLRLLNRAFAMLALAEVYEGEAIRKLLEGENGKPSGKRRKRSGTPRPGLREKTA